MNFHRDHTAQHYFLSFFSEISSAEILPNINLCRSSHKLHMFHFDANINSLYNSHKLLTFRFGTHINWSPELQFNYVGRKEEQATVDIDVRGRVYGGKRQSMSSAGFTSNSGTARPYDLPFDTELREVSRYCRKIHTCPSGRKKQLKTHSELRASLKTHQKYKEIPTRSHARLRITKICEDSVRGSLLV